MRGNRIEDPRARQLASITLFACCEVYLTATTGCREARLGGSPLLRKDLQRLTATILDIDD